MKKDFEAIEKIAITMAGIVWPEQTASTRPKKLEEEFAELMAELTDPCFDLDLMVRRLRNQCAPMKDDEPHFEKLKKIKGEMGDLLYVMLHLASMFGWTAKDLLHPTAMKVLERVNNPCYNRD